MVHVASACSSAPQLLTAVKSPVVATAMLVNG
jgi:hypothetical protein